MLFHNNRAQKLPSAPLFFLNTSVVLNGYVGFFATLTTLLSGNDDFWFVSLLDQYFLLQ